MHSVDVKAFRYVVERVVVLCKNGVLCRKRYALDASFGHRRGVAAADGVDDVAGFVDARLFHCVEHNGFEVLVEFGELPCVAVHDFEIILVRNGVDVDVVAVFENCLALVFSGERNRAAQTCFFRTAVEVDDAAAFGHFVWVFLVVFCRGKRDTDTSCVVHSAGRRRAGVLVRPERNEEATGDYKHRKQNVKRDFEVRDV